MEYKKDITSPSNNDKGQQSMNTQENSRISKDLSFVFRKTEKLTTALYMVTDIMAEREPMKWKMREAAVELVSGIGTAMIGTGGERMSALSDVLKKIERVISFLDIARASHMLSEMNASVLKKEYLTLKTALEYEWTKIFERDQHVLSDSFFHVPSDRQIEERKKSVADLSDKPQQSVPTEQNLKVSKSVSIPVVFFKKEDTANTTPVQSQGHSPMKVSPQRMHAALAHSDDQIIPRSFASAVGVDSAGDKGERRTIILALIKQRPNLGVKDFVKSLPAVSEKTIQRELLAMVSEGLLTKRGERRWSTYSLA